MATKTVEIYFSDLSKKAQKRLCKEFNTIPEKTNFLTDFAPIAIIEVEEDELD